MKKILVVILRAHAFCRCDNRNNQYPSRWESIEKSEEVVRQRNFDLLGIGKLLTLKSQTVGLVCPEFNELFERYGVE